MWQIICSDGAYFGRFDMNNDLIWYGVKLIFVHKEDRIFLGSKSDKRLIREVVYSL